ncbi:SRPBCC family protein [uncultured Tateyamaria sp.]|uniref:SRPBCC family protein n=1 Tax=Tateyamaria sp. 1078 TaxID=3417464 RepID=UPI0026239943|nr:SRPBCC family protein [uncultured Tateyamaria sp.]
MKFSAREDIEASIEDVFAALSEFETFERQAMRRGAEVQRVDDLQTPGVGASWRVAFTMRGRRRDMNLQLVRYDAPNEMGFTAKSPGMDAAFDVELLALSRTRTRMAVALELTPLNLASRLLVQSLKLAKSNLTKRYKQRVADYAKQLEERLKRSA